MTTPTRLDKWLWAARFYKTRALCRKAIEGGKVHYEGVRAKPSRSVDVGATVKIRQGFTHKIIVIDAVSDVRKDATFAQTLYTETEVSIETREREALLRKSASGNLPPQTKPNKKNRRLLTDLKHQS
jgi:ribosome-associated heat shock protein Hsp15